MGDATSGFAASCQAFSADSVPTPVAFLTDASAPFILLRPTGVESRVHSARGTSPREYMATGRRRMTRSVADGGSS